MYRRECSICRFSFAVVVYHIKLMQRALNEMLSREIFLKKKEKKIIKLFIYSPYTFFIIIFNQPL